MIDFLLDFLASRIRKRVKLYGEDQAFQAGVLIRFDFSLLFDFNHLQKGVFLVIFMMVLMVLIQMNDLKNRKVSSQNTQIEFRLVFIYDCLLFSFLCEFIYLLFYIYLNKNGVKNIYDSEIPRYWDK